jgi:hypothetical protein
MLEIRQSPFGGSIPHQVNKGKETSYGFKFVVFLLSLACGFGISSEGMKMLLRCNPDAVDVTNNDLKHKTIGLVIFLLAFMQAASGMLRPSGPKKPATPAEVSKDVEETFDTANESSNEFETTWHSNDDPDHEVSSHAKTSGKSIARRIWEYKHRIMGLGLLGLSWYNCDSGLEFFAERYGQDQDLSGAFWGVTSGLAGLICILYAVQIARR